MDGGMDGGRDGGMSSRGRWQADRDAVLIGSCPHSWLFERVAAVVHHGGAGTTAAGLRVAKVTHPLNTLSTPSQHPLNTPSQHTLSTHTLNTPSQHTLSTHPLNTLSTHPLDTHSILDTPANKSSRYSC